MPKIKITKREEQSLFKIYKPKNKTQKKLILREYRKQLKKHTKKYYTKSQKNNNTKRTYKTTKKHRHTSQKYKTIKKTHAKKVRWSSISLSPLRRRKYNNTQRNVSPDYYSISMTPPRRRRMTYIKRSEEKKSNELHITNQLKTSIKNIKNMNKTALKPILMNGIMGNCVININRVTHDNAFNISINLSVLCHHKNFEIINKTANSVNSLLYSLGHPKFIIKNYEIHDNFKSVFMYNNSNKGGIGVVRAVKQPNNTILLIVLIELFIPNEDEDIIDYIPEGINKILKKNNQTPMEIEI